ncbi:hypothetical protein SKAU_G00390980 [Synaphobranchus kaupii]|uniref:Zinc finger MYM-type protein 1 n=1 Tax=Synaphobranchus kaupii TaxID=118154 RepID=A0A9Q1EBJ3_SYNKA|nr:hypothetical protein SKAU_G00390980 [Synaphobranchus kaupii]
MKLSFFGRLSIAEQLDEGYRIGIRKHNEEVTKNRHILSRIIDCVKFCGAFELALRGHDETEASANPGIFRGLVNFVASLDGVLREHLENATVFKGTSKTVQNELLDCMYDVLREHIIKEVQSSDFLSIQADETMDIATKNQLVLVLRYIDDKNNVQERFFEFIALRSASSESIATALKDRLAVIIPLDQHKLICQAYDGASVMRGATAGEVCDTILGHAKERFSFTDHLVSATLLQGDRYAQYSTAFPEDALRSTLKAYPMLNGSKLKTELSLIYSKDEFKACCGAVDLFQLFMENNVAEVFSETVTLLKILITTPMTTAEAERCFSTLKRIKTFLRNTMTQDRLNALAMLSMEKRLDRARPPSARGGGDGTSKLKAYTRSFPLSRRYELFEVMRRAPSGRSASSVTVTPPEGLTQCRSAACFPDSASSQPASRTDSQKIINPKVQEQKGKARKRAKRVQEDLKKKLMGESRGVEDTSQGLQKRAT